MRYFPYVSTSQHFCWKTNHWDFFHNLGAHIWLISNCEKYSNVTGGFTNAVDLLVVEMGAFQHA